MKKYLLKFTIEHPNIFPSGDDRLTSEVSIKITLDDKRSKGKKPFIETTNYSDGLEQVSITTLYVKSYEIVEKGFNDSTNSFFELQDYYDSREKCNCLQLSVKGLRSTLQMGVPEVINED